MDTMSIRQLTLLESIVGAGLLARGVPGHVHSGVALVDYAGVQPHELVDDPVDGVLVAGDERGGEDDRVPGLDGDGAVLPVEAGMRDAHNPGIASCTVSRCSVFL